MNTERLSLSAFFIILTLSIGLVSVNSQLSLVDAQDSALSQNGNGQSEQYREQSHYSKQDGQAVSTGSSLLSGNNLLCQDQEISGLHESCNTSIDDLPSNPNGNTAQLVLYGGLSGPPICFGDACPNPNGFITVIDRTDNNRELATFEPFAPTPHSYDGPFSVEIPISHDITIFADPNPNTNFQYVRAEFQFACEGKINSCSLDSVSDNLRVGVLFTYTR
ncbi:MAG TPA: hypothetical protein VJR94_08535 [Candidatus Nitrosocosmicus sp.]|nr:hypothetical protein [Candidatus Nitrosocosmicus sp.]